MPGVVLDVRAAPADESGHVKWSIRKTLALAAVTAAALALALRGGAASADQPDAIPAIDVPAYDFRDCPALPTGADPHRWVCEVLVATGSMSFGRVHVDEFAPITVTHAEGPAPDGTTAQIFGNVRSAATRIPGGVFGRVDRHPLLRLYLRPGYGGYADFISHGDRLGTVDLTFPFDSGLLDDGCVAGDAVRFQLVRTAPTEVVSTDPRILRMHARDDTFPVPSAHGCGRLTGYLNHRLGLPSAAGHNQATFTGYLVVQPYDRW
jgi:hypothetical protein